jgi:hypothetical protein
VGVEREHRPLPAAERLDAGTGIVREVRHDRVGSRIDLRAERHLVAGAQQVGLQS